MAAGLDGVSEFGVHVREVIDMEGKVILRVKSVSPDGLKLDAELIERRLHRVVMACVIERDFRVRDESMDTKLGADLREDCGGVSDAHDKV